MDWMANLTREHVNGAKGGGGTETNLDVEFAEVLSRSYRTLMMGRRSEIGEKDLEMLLGPVNAHLFVGFSHLNHKLYESTLTLPRNTYSSSTLETPP
jgi:hypothetical protein